MAKIILETNEYLEVQIPGMGSVIIRHLPERKEDVGDQVTIMRTLPEEVFVSVQMEKPARVVRTAEYHEATAVVVVRKPLTKEDQDAAED